MTTNRIIVRKYTLVVFNLAKKLNLIEQFAMDFRKLSEYFLPSVVREFSNPIISRLELSKIIKNFAEELSLHSKFILFLELLSHSKRINLIREIELHFTQLVKEDNKVIQAIITSASPLSADNLQAITINLQSQYPNFLLEIKSIIKKDILGGLIIKIGSKVIDASLRTQLSTLEKQLKQSIN